MHDLGESEKKTLLSAILFAISCFSFMKLSRKSLETNGIDIETSNSATINILQQPIEVVRFPWEPSLVRHPGNQSNSNNVTDEDKSAKKQDVVIYYGTIEKNVLSRKADNVNTGSKKLETNDKQLLQGQQEQLDFLASMTFAGGGLRQPFCPCCQ